jgi:hypothetical protein
MVNEGIASGVLPVLNAVWLSYDCGTNTFHIYARAETHVRVHCRFRHAHSSPIRGNEVRFCLLNFPHQACRGKLEDKEILCFQLNFSGKFRRQKRMHGNEGNTWLNVPVETKETELTMVLLYKLTLDARITNLVQEVFNGRLESLQQRLQKAKFSE